jgi:hypothetical protein
MDPGWEGGGGVLAGGVRRSERLARAVAVCARGSMRVSRLAAEEDIPADRPRDDLDYHDIPADRPRNELEDHAMGVGATGASGAS